MEPPIGGSFWKPSFLGSMSNLGRVILQITLLRVIPTMTCRVVVVRWGLSGWIRSVIFPTRDKEPWRNPSHLFSGLLRALVVSCPPFSIAPDTNHAKSCQRRTRNMPNHVRTPPGKHISRSILCTKHAKSCQDTTCQTNINNQASNMAAYPLKQSQKLIVAATAHAQITNALQCVTRCILCTKHAKSCQDTTCQHISRINRRHQTCQ